MSESLYRDTLKDHMHHQRFAGRLEPADLKAVVHNPLCGDELELTIVLGGDPSEGARRPIQEARNQVRACSICVASASLMGENIQGLSLEEANNLGTTFREAMETGELPDSPPEFLSPLMAIRKHKSRIRCAALAWNALEECTQQVTNPKSEG